MYLVGGIFGFNFEREGDMYDVFYWCFWFCEYKLLRYLMLCNENFLFDKFDYV